VLEAVLGAERAGRIARRHEAFCDAPMTDAGRLFMRGAMDPMAIRQRAIVTAQMIAARQGRWSGDVQIASVACGAAGPVAQIAAGIDGPGIESIGLTLLDRDPMALAAAQVIAREDLPAATLRSQLVDLVDMQSCRAVDLKPMAGDGWDVVDVLGLFEYLPDALAVDLLRSARAALRPQGIVVVANMLDQRPQQTFFSDVVRWPAVIQRSPERFMRLIEAAGFRRRQVALAIPEAAPIYTVAAIDTAA
jgi:SAM-dependent methyltransferase